MKKLLFTFSLLFTIHIAFAQPTVTVTSTHATCANPSGGKAEAHPIGGSSPYSYLWGPIGYAGNPASNLPPGQYTVTITDALGLTAAAATTITGPIGFQITTNKTAPSFCGATDGSISVGASGLSDYSFIWFNGSTASSINGLTSGTYAVTVTDNNDTDCTKGTAISLNAHAELIPTFSKTDVDCNGVSGMAYITNVSGGTPPYKYYWVVGSTQNMIDMLLAGTYPVTITDANSCTNSASVTIESIPAPTITEVSKTAPSCSNGSDGTVTVLASGGTPPYNYTWNTNPPQNTATATGLATGLYNVTVIDASTCKRLLQVPIGNPGNLYCSLFTKPANCGNNGSASAHLEGGTPPYAYLWDTNPTQTTETATGLAGGDYNITITDNGGCTQTHSVNIPTQCKNFISGKAYYDNNGNCNKDIDDNALSGVITANNGSDVVYGYPNSDGTYKIAVNDGAYSLSYNLPAYYQLNCPIGLASFTGINGTEISGKDIAISAIPNVKDLEIYSVHGLARPGFTQTNIFSVKNAGGTIQNASASVKFDSLLTYVSSNPTATSYTDSTITWDFTNFAPGQQFSPQYTLQVATPQNGGQLGKILHYTIMAEPIAGDTTPTNNIVIDSIAIQGSYDPNDKAVIPSDTYIQRSDSLLTYTIRFQNTGTDTAFTVVIRDTLSSHLNVSSLQILMNSHPCELSITDNNALAFTFNHILLVDSFHNEPMSHGFVRYSIKIKPNTPDYDGIDNTASIYFDFNDPVVTNTVSTQISVPDGVSNLLGKSLSEFTLAPNPTNTSSILTYRLNTPQKIRVCITDLSGRMVKNQDLPVSDKGQLTLDASQYSQGIYFCTLLVDDKPLQTIKWVVLH